MDGELNGRVVGLERRVRQLTGFIIVMIIFILAIVLIGVVKLRSATSPGRLAITDRNGNEVAVLRAYGSLPGLRFLKGPEGKLIPKLGEVKPEPNLRLFDERGIDTVRLSSGQFGQKLSLTDPEAKMGAVLALQGEAPSLWFWLAEGEGSSLLSLDEYGPRLWLLDDRGKRGPSLRFTKDINNKPRLVLLDELGKTVWSTP